MRPKIKVPWTTGDRVLEISGWILLLALWGFVVFSYPDLPDKIPKHFNAAGQADSWGGKKNILSLSVVMTILFVGMTLLNRFPHIFNYPFSITDENAFRQYACATRMLRWLKTIIVVIFGYLAIAAIYGMENIGIWFLPVTAGLILIPMFYWIARMCRLQ